MKRIGILIALYLAIGLQISISAPIRSLPWDIDIVLLAIILIASFTSRGEGVFWALIAGVLLDAFDPSSMGGHIVAKSSAVFLFIILNSAMNLHQPSLLALALFLLSILDRLIFRLFTPFIGSYGFAFLHFDLPSAVLTTIVGFVVLWIVMRYGGFSHGHFPEKDVLS
jgi:rod shape-determining protein MreD